METSKNLPVKGYLSVRRSESERICIVLEQDESTCLPHSLKGHFWSAEGHIPKRNKTDGLGTMMSLLISRELGFAFNFTCEK